MIAEKFKNKKETLLVPVGSFLLRNGFTANQFTFLGVWFSLCFFVLIVSQSVFLAVTVLILAGVCDFLDGAIARSANEESNLGKFLDSTSDRLSDILILLGLTVYVYYTSSQWAALAAASALGLSLLVSYQKSLGEIFGVGSVGGLMERAERFVAVVLVLVTTGTTSLALLLIFVGLLVLTNIQRFVVIKRELGRPPKD